VTTVTGLRQSQQNNGQLIISRLSRLFPIHISTHPVISPNLVKEQEIRKRKANWIGHILRRNCLLQRVIEGKIKGDVEVTGRRGRKRRKLLDDLKERRGYCHLKEEAPDRTVSRVRFGDRSDRKTRKKT